MGWEPWIIVAVGFLAVGAAMRGWSWWMRERVVRALSDRPLVRSARGVSLRVLSRGARVLPGMTSNRAHRTRGDLLLLDGRFVVASSRGKLLDVSEAGTGPGLPVRSIRCPGPGKLVIEGSVPRAEGDPGLFRIETLVPDAVEWARALQPFVTRAGEGPAYATHFPDA